MFILLPNKITVLRPRKEQIVQTDKEEFNLYFENLIHPYSDSLDVHVKCEYGKNYGSFWRLEDYPYEVDEFELSIIVYDENGRNIASKSTTVELCQKDTCHTPFSVLAIGDSMTQSQKYLEHAAGKLRGVRFVGSRSFDGVIAHEGRGGFASEDYRYKHQDPYAYSPFVFPVGVSAQDYFGDITFWTTANEHPESHYYVYDGYARRQLLDGQIYNRNDVLYCMKGGAETVYQENPQWEFNFGKYLQQQSFLTPDIVSVLLGTNDIMKLTYADMESGIEKTLQNMDVIIESIRLEAPQSAVIINLPILSTTSDFAFAKNFGTKKTAKQSRLIMKKYLKRLIEKWDGKEAEGIYLVPMYAVIDPLNAYETDSFSIGIHYRELQNKVGETIHPTASGYFQMGDAMAAVIQKIRIAKGG